MRQKKKRHVFELDYRNCLKDEPIIQACQVANRCGLEGDKIEKVETAATFGQGLRVTFTFKEKT